MKKNKKAYVIYDFIFAIAIFIFIFIFINTSYNNYKDDLILQNKADRLKIEAKQLCNLIQNSKGISKNWNTISNPNFNETQIGIIRTQDNNFTKLTSCQKIQKLNNTNYQDIKKSFKIKENLYLKIENFNKNSVSSDTNWCDKDFIIEKGIRKTNTSSFASTACFLKNENNEDLIKVTIELWEQKI